MKTTTTKITIINFLKRALIPCIVVATLHPALAQPIFTNADMPATNASDSILKFDFDRSTLLTSGVDTTGGSAGALQTWNYSGLTLAAADSSNWTVYLAPAATPYPSAFSAATFSYMDVASSTGDTIYFYVKSSVTEAREIGFVLHTSLQTVVAEDFIVMKFPFTMTSTFSDTINDTIPGFATFNQIKKVSGDGYGTLVLPHQTFTNVLKVKSTAVHNDTSIFGVQFFVDTIFKWYASGDAVNPLFSLTKIDGTTALGATVHSLDATIYKRSSSNSGIESYDGAISSTYPVPAKNELNIRLSNQEKVSSVLITDLYGRQVFSKSVQSNHGETLTIPLNNLSSGTFFVSILDNSKNVMGRSKFIKVN